MKRYLITVLVCLLPIIAQSQKSLLYEYTEDDCYYTLELDTLRDIGRFCAVDCYNQLKVIEISFSLWRSGQERFFFISHTYLFSKYGTDPDLQLYLDTTDLINRDFFFWYDVKDNWQHLEYGYFHFDNEMDNGGYFSELGQKTARLSPFFKENNILWFPPRLVRVKKIDYDRFPKKYRKEIKKRRLK